MRLEVEDIARSFDGQAAVDGLSFVLEAGEIGCLLGPSGCGKTTALRCIAGFEVPERGRIHANGDELAGAGGFVPPERRNIGMVFQDYALFPHLDVGRNVGFGLARLDRASRRRRVAELLELVGLPGLESRFPDELSGGQQQRVALARALAPNPRLVLLDEPFSNLDIEVRHRLAREVREMLRRAGATALLVTHDQQEAFAIADRIGVMRAGRLEQWDTAWRLYHAPATRFVADFVGEGVFVAGTVLGDGRVQTALGSIGGDLTRPLPAGTEVDLLLRPDDVIADPASPLKATVLDRAFRGAEFLYTLALPGGESVLAVVPSHVDREIGAAMGLRVEARHLVVFPRSGGEGSAAR